MYVLPAMNDWLLHVGMVLGLVIESLFTPGSPPTCRCELLAFPNRDHCFRQKALNREYETFLKVNYEYDVANKAYWGQLLVENRRLYMVWEALDDAWFQECNWANVNNLEYLRFLLGTEDYYAGRMPASHSLWRYHR